MRWIKSQKEGAKCLEIIFIYYVHSSTAHVNISSNTSLLILQQIQAPLLMAINTVKYLLDQFHARYCGKNWDTGLSDIEPQS